MQTPEVNCGEVKKLMDVCAKGTGIIAELRYTGGLIDPDCFHEFFRHSGRYILT